MGQITLEDTKDMFYGADDLIKEGKYDAAITVLNVIIPYFEKFGDDNFTSMAFDALATSYYKKEDHTQAIANFKKAADYGSTIAMNALKAYGVNYTPQKPSSSSAPNSGGSSATATPKATTPTAPQKVKWTLKDGSVYEGEIVNDRPNGKGKRTWPDGAVYEGDFVDGNFCGKGKFTFNGEVYIGDFINGKYNGKGKYTWPDGDVYEGDYVDGIFHGKGKFTLGKGGFYEGDFVKGKRHGKGKMINPDGKIENGNWENNKFIG